MANPPPPQTAQLIQAPARPPITHPTTLFLAGTTTASAGNPDWRATLSATLADLPVTIFNPLRPDWDSSWREDVSFAPFREQVEWELDMQDRAALVVVYFGAGTDAPISLLELGLCARSGRAVVVCHRGYRKRGNVEIVCRRLGVEVVDADLGEGEWLGVVRRRVEGLIG